MSVQPRDVTSQHLVGVQLRGRRTSTRKKCLRGLDRVRVSEHNRGVFGEALEAALAKARMTQAELASATGVRQQTVSKWLNGRSLPGPGRLEAIERAAGTRKGALVAAAMAESSRRLAEASPATRERRRPVEHRLRDLEERLSGLEAKVDQLLERTER